MSPTIPQRFPDKYIELMVIADSTMYKKYGDYTEKYVLTVVNQVQLSKFCLTFIILITLVSRSLLSH